LASRELSDSRDEFGEGYCDPQWCRLIDRKLIVSAAKVL
jgi:hypothetical protein